MKSWLKAILWITVIAGVFWVALGRRYYMRLQQEKASSAMVEVTSMLVEFVDEHGRWPQSWDELDPVSESSTRLVVVDWTASVESLDPLFEVIVHNRVHFDGSTVPASLSLPMLVTFSDNVPRDEHTADRVKWWNCQLVYQMLWAHRLDEADTPIGVTDPHDIQRIHGDGSRQ